MPALPYYYGQLHFGGPPVIELRLVNSKEQKGYGAGEKIGDFTVVSFDSDSVTFEWNGEEVVRKVADLKPKQEQQPQAAAPPPPAQSSASSSGVIAIGANDSNSAASSVPDVVGPDVGGGFYGCKAGDATPSGTVVSGYQKTSSQGLMGPSCRWERLNR